MHEGRGDVPLLKCGRYLIADEIAAGGMATVHAAVLVGEGGFARSVAVKRLRPEFARNEEFVATLVDEARLTSRIHHPNVVPTLDVLENEGETLLVVELVHGQSLAELLKAARLEGTEVPRSVLLAILLNVLAGLQAAHDACDENGAALHLVHRDVTPQNILVGTDGVARITDFGIAKAVARAQITREGQLKGKLSYLSPEQLRRQPIDRRADIYPVGVILWEGLTGVRLFRSSNEQALIVKVLEGRVDPPTRVVDGLDPMFDEIVRRSLALDPNDRYATAREMAAALGQQPAAGVEEVGAWVASLAADSLETRAALMSDVERRARDALETDKTTAPVADEPTRIAPSRQRTKMPRLAAAVLLGGPVALFAIANVGRSASAPVPLAIASSSESAALEAPAPGALETPLLPAPQEQPQRADVPGRASPAGRRVDHPADRNRTRVRPPRCNPPYELDAEGLRHVKRECL